MLSKNHNLFVKGRLLQEVVVLLLAWIVLILTVLHTRRNKAADYVYHVLLNDIHIHSLEGVVQTKICQWRFYLLVFIVASQKGC